MHVKTVLKPFFNSLATASIFVVVVALQRYLLLLLSRSLAACHQRRRGGSVPTTSIRLCKEFDWWSVHIYPHFCLNNTTALLAREDPVLALLLVATSHCLLPSAHCPPLQQLFAVAFQKKPLFWRCSCCITPASLGPCVCTTVCCCCVLPLLLTNRELGDTSSPFPTVFARS